MEILSRIQQILNALHLCGAESPAAARNKMLMETTHRSKQRASRNKTDELSKQCDIKSSRHLADLVCTNEWFVRTGIRDSPWGGQNPEYRGA
jgi:hypothetical protein